MSHNTLNQPITSVTATSLPEAEFIEFDPIWDWVLVEVVRKDKTAGGIMLPDNVKSMDDTIRARVLKAGPGQYRNDGTFVPNVILPGDYVYYMGMMKPLTLKYKGEDYLVMAARDLVGIYRPKAGQKFDSGE